MKSLEQEPERRDGLMFLLILLFAVTPRLIAGKLPCISRRTGACWPAWTPT